MRCTTIEHLITCFDLTNLVKENGLSSSLDGCLPAEVQQALTTSLLEIQRLILVQNHAPTIVNLHLSHHGGMKGGTCSMVAQAQAAQWIVLFFIKTRLIG
jgi:hypothetical protein